jgi:hypothetical protein
VTPLSTTQHIALRGANPHIHRPSHYIERYLPVFIGRLLLLPADLLGCCWL